MKQCPRCHRTYADDTLSFCLDDGTRLVRGYDSDATQVSPFPPQPSAPTIAYGAPTLPSTLPPAAQTPPGFTAPAAPAPRKRPMLAIVAVFAALVIGVGIGGFIFQRYSSPSSEAATPTATPTPPYSVASTTATPKPVATPTPAPAATPTPSPIATPSQSVVQSTPEPKTECVLYNDVADRSAVRVRADCDMQDCDNDSSTVAGEYPNDTPVRVVKGAKVQGARFTWVKVIIIDSGQAVWVASTKIKCG